MAGPIIVEGPDGQEYEFPEGTSPDVMKQAMRKRYGGGTPAPPAPAMSPFIQKGIDMVNAPDRQPTMRASLPAATAPDRMQNRTDSAVLAKARKVEQDIANATRKARVAPVDRRAAEAGSAATTQQLQGMSPFVAGMGGANAAQIAGQSAGQQIYDEAGVMSPSGALEVRGLNSVALGIPAMVNEDVRNRVGQAGLDRPGESLAGDIAGYLIPGELAWQAGRGLYNAALRPAVNALMPQGGSALARGTRLAGRTGEQAAGWAGQNALFQGSVGASTQAAEEGRPVTLSDVGGGAASGATDPFNLAGPAALMGANRLLTYIRTGGASATPSRIAEEVSLATGGRSNPPQTVAGSVLDMGLAPSDLRPQAIQRVIRGLEKAGMSREDISGLFQSVQQRLSSLPEAQVGRLTLGQALLEALEDPQLSRAAGVFPQAAFNLRQVLRGASQGGRLGETPRQGDQRAGIVAGVRRELQGSQSEFVTESAARNLGEGEVTGVRSELEAERTRLGQQYEDIFSSSLGQTDPAVMQQVQDAINFYRNDSKLMERLKQVALGKRMTVDQYIAQDPRRALHWMQSAAREIVDAERAAPSPSKITLNTYTTVRTQMLDALDRAVPGYNDVRGPFGTVEEIDTALSAGRNFLGRTQRNEDLADFLTSLGNLSPEAQQGALLSIRDEINMLIGRGGEEASARIAQLTSANALRTLESLGAGGRALADDLRFLKREQQFLGNTIYGSDTFRNMKASEAEALGNSGLANMASGQGGMAGALAKDMLVSSATQTPMSIFTPLRLLERGTQAVFGPRTSTLNDEIRFLMGRRGNIPELPQSGTADFSAPPPPAQPPNALATPPAGGPVRAMGMPAVRITGGDAAKTLAGTAGGGAYGTVNDVNRDGVIDERDVEAGATIGASLGASAAIAPRISRRLLGSGKLPSDVKRANGSYKLPLEKGKSTAKVTFDQDAEAGATFVNMEFEGAEKPTAREIHDAFQKTFRALEDHATRFGDPVYTFGTLSSGHERTYLRTIQKNAPPEGYQAFYSDEFGEFFLVRNDQWAKFLTTAVQRGVNDLRWVRKGQSASKGTGKGFGAQEAREKISNALDGLRSGIPTSVGDAAISGLMGSGTGSVMGSQYDLNGDGEINALDMQIGAGAGMAAFMGGPRAYGMAKNALAGTRPAGFGGGKKPPLLLGPDDEVLNLTVRALPENPGNSKISETKQRRWDESMKAARIMLAHRSKPGDPEPSAAEIEAVASDIAYMLGITDPTPFLRATGATADVIPMRPRDPVQSGFGGGRKPPPKMGKGGAKSKAPNPDAIRESVRKVAEGMRAKGIEAKPQPPEMRVGKGMSKLMGIKDDPATSMKVATDMLKAGRTSDEIWEATSRLPIKIEGRTILMRGEGATPEEVQAAFWQEMAKPYSKRAPWAQKGTEGIFPVGPNSIARKSADERIKAVASRVARSPTDARFRKDIWEETGVVVIGKDASGQMVTRNNKLGSDFEPVALMDGKEFKTFDEVIAHLEAIAKLPRADQPDWYRSNFSEVLDTSGLRRVGKNEYTARRIGEEVLKRPRVYGLTAGGALGAGGVVAVDAELKRRQAANR